MRPPKRVAPARRPERARRGHWQMLVRVTEAQALALREEATRRAEAAGSIRPDVSALVREALDAWMVAAAKTTRK